MRGAEGERGEGGEGEAYIFFKGVKIRVDSNQKKENGSEVRVQFSFTLPLSNHLYFLSPISRKIPPFPAMEG